VEAAKTQYVDFEKLTKSYELKLFNFQKLVENYVNFTVDFQKLTESYVKLKYLYYIFFVQHKDKKK
tara:strand:+ start:719 stop:916 length:198 start_codon:yes stop_codon:yes gene_type:complete